MWPGRDEAPINIAFFSPLSKYTKYNYILGIAQHVAEKVIGSVAEERGIKVHRPHKVTDMRPSAEDPSFTDVIFEDGHVLRAHAVVGADGARSTVSCGLPTKPSYRTTADASALPLFPCRFGIWQTCAMQTRTARSIPTLRTRPWRT